jgi:phage I-like protein
MIQPTFPIPFSDDGTPPTEIRLFGAGSNATSKGPVKWTARSAALVEAEYVARGVEKFADYEHRSLLPLDRQQEHATIAAAWYRLAVRDGELWAVDIKWTPPAIEKLTAKEFRYFSPAVEVDPKTNEVTKFVNFALTNNPATHNLPALVAASEGAPMDEKMQKCAAALSAALEAMGGTDPDAMKAAFTAAKSALAELMPEDAPGAPEEKVEEEKAMAALSGVVLALTGKSAIDEQVGVLHALKAQADTVTALTAELGALKQSQLADKIAAVVKAGADARKLSPADLAGATPLGLAIKGFVDGGNLVALSALVDVLPSKIAGEVIGKPASALTLTAEEQEIDRGFGNEPGWVEKQSNATSGK